MFHTKKQTCIIFLKLIFSSLLTKIASHVQDQLHLKIYQRLTNWASDFLITIKKKLPTANHIIKFSSQPELFLKVKDDYPLFVLPDLFYETLVTS